MNVSRLVVAGCAALIASGCVHSRAECVEHDGQPWREVTSAHFRVKTNLDSETAREATLELEKARKALLFAFDNKVDPPGRVDTIILRSQYQMDEFKPDAEGMMGELDGAPLIVLAAQSFLLDAPPSLALIMHGLALHLSSYYLVRQPHWFSQGLAGYLQTMRPYGSGEEMRMGEANHGYLFWIRGHGRVPFEELWRWTDNEQLRDAEQTARYATSWLWVHFLMNKHPRKMDEFQARLARAQEPRTAWNETFGAIPHDALERELNEYIRTGTYSAMRFQLTGVSPRMDERLLDAAEVHVARAQLVKFLGDNRSGRSVESRIQAEVDAARALDPMNPDAELISRAAFRDAAGRLSLMRELAQRHPENAQVQLALATALMNRPDAAEERRAALVKALQLAPDDVRILNATAWDYALAGQAKVALPFAQKAVRLAPWSADVLDTYALALARAGRCQEAVVAQRRAMEVMGGASSAARQRFAQRLAEYEQGCAAPAAP